MKPPRVLGFHFALGLGLLSLAACPSEGEGEAGESESESESGGSGRCDEQFDEAACMAATDEYTTCGWFESSIYAADDTACMSPTPGGLCHTVGSADDCGGNDIQRAWRAVEDGVELADVVSSCAWPPANFDSCTSEDAPEQCACE